MPKPSFEEMRRKLLPETIRANLVRSSLFLAGWELLKIQVVDNVRDFFLGAGDDYKTDVLARHKKKFEASLLWLVEVEAITEDQATAILRLLDRRNEIAHELPKMLTDPAHEVELALIRETKTLLDVLGRFWCRVEIDISPKFDGKTIADEDISSGIMMLMDHLLAAAEDVVG
jgi:hypothetical protein